jgi:reductive dehalogenase
MLTDKQKDEQYTKFRLNRRNFLKAGTGLATMAGLFSVMNKKHIAEAATDTVLNKAGLNGASYKLREVNDSWLGTSKIVGPIRQKSELEIGFYQAAQGFFGAEAKKGVGTFIPKHPLGGAISSMRKFIATEDAVNGVPSPNKLLIPDPERMSKHIKETALFLHADEVGIGVMPNYAFYTNNAPPLPKVLYEGTANLTDLKPVPENQHYPYVIGILVDQNLTTMLGSTGYDGISGAMSMNAYLFSGLIACTLAAYIRNLGYNARAQHCANYQMTLPPALIAAGLGEMSRTGECAIHPRLGFRHKAAAVTTDLPLLPDKPIDFGLLDFCSKCKKCAENCPAGAISFDNDQKEFNGYYKWLNDMPKCTVFRTTNSEGSSCGRCMKVCPWNDKEQSWVHSVGTWAASRSGTAAKLLKDVDDMFGYGTEVVQEYRWWLEWPELYKK